MPAPAPRVVELADADATVAFGARLAAVVAPAAARPCCISLTGELGAGKTTLVRGLLHALGHVGNVKSPTYTLVEPYEVGGFTVFHLDLYRLADPEELEFLGVRELGEDASVILVEWAERGRGFLPPVDLDISLTAALTGMPAVAGSGRQARLTAQTPRGVAMLANLDIPA